MTNKIFNRFEVARKDIFQTVIDEMLRVGWVQKNKGASSENNSFDMYSDGNDNKKNIFLALIPFDGRNSESAPSTNSSYDIRKSDYADPFFRFFEGYDENSNSRINITDSNPLGWFFGRRYNTGFTKGKGPTYDKDAIFELYVFADKERVIVATIAPEYLSGYNVVSYIGVPDDLYLKDSHEPFTRAIYAASTAFSGVTTSSVSAQNQGWMFAGPESFPSSTKPYRSTTSYFTPLKNPTIDKSYILSPIFVETKDEGVRGRLDGIFYLSGTTNLSQGDFIEIPTDEGIQKYRYLACVSNVANTYSLPSDIVIRVS